MSEGNGKLRRADRAPPRTGPEFEVKRLKGGQGGIFTILSAVMWGCFIHYDLRVKRSEKCLENSELCPGCIAKLPQKWRGYLYVRDSLAKCFFLEVTPDMDRLLHLHLGRDRNFRGLAFFLERSKADNGRVKVQRVDREREPDSVLPVEEDPEPILRWLWDWRRTR